ncbi:MAG TPA: TonB-dependent receptor, partial [Bryobacteraceae bacterium]|nr:TonB-dependent receptor [Bryobacteraceae bacterium]
MTIRSVFAICALVGAMFAQEFRATISGQVTDPSGAAIPGATVKAINIETNDTTEAKTTTNGLYSIPYLNPGVYTVEVVANGFQTLKREGIRLEVAGKINLPLQLTVGQMTQEVTVTGQQEVIDTSSADRGLVFDPIKTQEYPLNGRQTYMLMSLTPGVVFTQEQFGASGFSGTRGWDVNSSYKINGARSGGGMNMFLLNGAPITDNTGGSWQLAPNVEAVEEFKVMTNTYDAGYGRFAGGVVNTTLKSGTNSWHGDVFEYWRNRILDANNFGNNTIGAPKGFHNQHQFGGVVGGPVRHNKDFVFASFEGWQEVVPFPASGSTPPVSLRDGQHFTDFGYKIYDPLTTHACNPASEPCQGQAFIHNPFPDNVIPLSRISPVGAKILSYYPAANGADPKAINNNFIAKTNLGRYYYEQPMARWDHVFGPNDKLFGLYTGQQGYEYRSSTGFPKPVATGNTNNQRTDQNAVIDYTHVAGARTVLDVRLSFGRFIQTTPGFSDFSVTAQTLGMTGFKPSPVSPGPVAPSINIGGYSNPGFSGGTAFSWTATNNWNLTPSLTMTRGRHTIRTGVEFNYAMRGSTSTGSSNGSFTFNQTWTQQTPAQQHGATDGSGVATLLLGYPTSGNIDYNDTFYRTRPYYGLYVQDDWKVSDHLTLNLGLRYDIQVGWLERYNRSNRGFDTTVKNPLSDQIIAAWAKDKAAYDATGPKYPYPAVPSVITGGFLFAGVNGQPQRLYDTDWTAISPRVGIAYRIGDKTVIRAGAGIYYQQTTQLDTTTGYSQGTPYTSSTTGDNNTGLPKAGNSLNGPFSLVNPFPNGILAPSGNSLGLLTNVGNSISFDPPYFKVPRTYQYSLGIQRELKWGIVAEVSYAGNYQNHI